MLLSEILRLFNSAMTRSIIRTFLARALSAFGAIFLVVVTGWNYGPSGVGGLALAQSILLGAGLLSKGGMDAALMRFVGSGISPIQSFSYLFWSIRKSLFFAFFATVFLIAFRADIESFFGVKGISVLLLGFSLSIPAYVVAYLLSGFFKGAGMPASACLMENGAISLYAGLGVLAWSHYFQGVRLEYVGYFYFLASLVVLFQGAGRILLWRRRNFITSSSLSEAAFRVSDDAILGFRSVSRSFLATNFSAFIQNVLAVLLAGWMLASDELGFFKVSQQVGLLISFILIVLNSILPPRFSRLYHEGNVLALSRLARKGSLLGVFSALPMVAFCFFFPGLVLGFFGDEFRGGEALLRIIVLAQFVNVVTGSVGFLLSMTGHEKLMRNISLVGNFIGLCLFFILMHYFSAVGAALALAFILVFQHVVALYYVWKKLGIWTIPLPNFFLAIGVNPSSR